MDVTKLASLFQDPKICQIWSQTQEHLQKYSQGVKDGTLTLGDKTLKFRYFMKGDRPKNGYSLLFGMHGGGGCPAKVNDSQFQNHLKLYDSVLPNGVIWLVPRSCQDVWDMWFQSYLVDFYTIIIRTFVIEELVDPNKVFISGYSAGGDGTYHLTPMLADLLAGGAMMGGHPNGVELYNNRNLVFSIQCGGKDGAYDRNKHSRQYIQKMKELRDQYGGFDTKYCNIHEDCQHWMKLKDGQIFDSFLGQARNPYPSLILFKQHPRIQKRYFYYIEVDPKHHKELIIVNQRGNDFYIESQRIPIKIYINRNTVNFSQEVKVYHNNTLTVEKRPQLNYQVVTQSVRDRMDPYYLFEDCLVSNPNNDRAPLQQGVNHGHHQGHNEEGHKKHHKWAWCW